MKFIEAKTKKEARDQMPEMVAIKKVTGGYAGFETWTDLSIWEDQNKPSRKAPQSPPVRFSEQDDQTPNEESNAPHAGTGASTKGKKQIVTRMDEDLHRKLKIYAARHNTTVQRLVEVYLKSLVRYE